MAVPTRTAILDTMRAAVLPAPEARLSIVDRMCRSRDRAAALKAWHGGADVIVNTTPSDENDGTQQSHENQQWPLEGGREHPVA